jgi:hypothetical protein
MLGVGLRADRDIFTGRHRHGPGNQARDAGKQDLALRCGRRGHAENETRGGDDAAIGSENGGTQPADPVYDMALFVLATHERFLRRARPGCRTGREDGKPALRRDEPGSIRISVRSRTIQ